jgi:hypothetical protein
MRLAIVKKIKLLVWLSGTLSFPGTRKGLHPRALHCPSGHILPGILTHPIPTAAFRRERNKAQYFIIYNLPEIEAGVILPLLISLST